MRRRAAAGALLALPLVALVATAVLLSPRLGPVMASHWSELGRPDGLADTWPSFWTLGGVSAAATLGALLCLGGPRAVALVLGVVAGTTAMAWAVPAGVTALAAAPQEAVLGASVLLVVLPLLSAAAAYRLLPTEDEER